jgi:hypothetical protein
MKLKVEHFHAYDLVSIYLINQAKYYAQNTGNQYSILGRLICLPDCDKTSADKNDIFIFNFKTIIRVFRFINCFPFLIPKELTKYQAK